MYTVFQKSQNQPPYLLLRQNSAAPLNLELVALFAHAEDAADFVELREGAAVAGPEIAEGDLRRVIDNVVDRIREVNKDEPEEGEIDQALQSATDNQRKLFRFMKERAGKDGLFSMRYKEITRGCGVPSGTINSTASSLQNRGLVMLARPGNSKESPIYQVANGHLLNQGA